MVRMRRPSIAAVEQALYDDRSVVRHHAMRRTLWVATPPVARTMHAAATRRVAGQERRRTLRLLADNGVADPEAWLADARDRTLAALEEHGPLTARRLGELVPALRHPLAMSPGKPYATTAAAHTRVLLGLGFEGAVIRTRPSGSWVSGAYAYAATDTWISPGLDGAGPTDPVDPVDPAEERRAAVELADLWLRRFGPGTTADLQWWAGWTTALTRHALEGCGAVPVDLDGAPGWVAADDEAPVGDAGPWVAALPSLDPTTMGWKQRAWYLPDSCHEAFDRNGNAGPTLWVDGEVVGAWGQRPDGELRSHYFVDVPARRRAELDAELDRVAGMLAEHRVSVRFPGRIHATLLG
ncbi:winged helix DNA-binding domain-containing protein [Nocardioides mesophilus]|uniref:AlkZ family DNA glycosylase n=1 Tax=Nocardioides mesophilus TaxID=433659 RepID=A0A7G9RHY8_9ACTN|nr:winged helix DNA-binding domain-containing protein [Nocardioides mesophilus]QNN55213.1 AlkZ family DNA glycosylase [Nocardioides mesophilus]